VLAEASLPDSNNRVAEMGFAGQTSAMDYQRVERAIRFLDEHHTEQPSLPRVAAAAGLSESHFQRLFKRWAGVSPKRFLQYATAEHARQLLLDSRPVLEAALDAGLSGPGRLHDLTVNVHAMTPGEIRQGGAGTTVRYGLHDTPFGHCFLARTERGVCALRFGDGLAEERARWPAAEFVRDDAATAEVAARAFAGGAISLDLHGTNFQIRVWEALLRIPTGSVTSYGALARRIERPGAARAVGRAVGSNHIAVLIPCHRVLRETGAFGGYRWGLERKRALLACESSR
jgi:AraC family transcriptional regulator of adaptative response/methylated-DNA-[protein]-cysteine methyltransferase